LPNIRAKIKEKLFWFLLNIHLEGKTGQTGTYGFCVPFLGQIDSSTVQIVEEQLEGVHCIRNHRQIWHCCCWY
jgi:hypothetical protein